MRQSEHIPRIRKRHATKRTNRTFLLLIYLFFTTVLVILFLRSPLSKVSEIEITGNELLRDETILSASGLQPDMPFFGIDTDEVEQQIEQLLAVDQANVDRDFPGRVRVEIQEYRNVAFLVGKNGRLLPLLENGKTLPADWDGVIDRPIVTSFKRDDLLEQLASELKSLDRGVAAKISEIQHWPSDTDPYRLRLYMKDGNEVHTSIRDFSQNMNWYPSFVRYLEEEGKSNGIVTLLDGKWFVPYEPSTTVKEEMEPEENAAGEETQHESP
ncbi:MAG: FtsQ-type POTRA domain-containing protein [Bacillaceae bacterium]|nr:FtsQ-type POTRA domain-containing protein [Bacillaceae bacterium]